MKKTLSICLFTIIVVNSFAQSPLCANATAFCTGTNYTFPASTNTTGNLYHLFPQHTCCGYPFLPPPCALVVIAGFELSRPPRATRTVVIVIVFEPIAFLNEVFN